MIDHDFYVQNVLPHLETPFVDQYPRIQLQAGQGYHPLSEHDVLMLVALTGTGKTTTMTHLETMAGKIVSDAMGIIPSRREIADWITIPTAQVILDKSIQPVGDRVERFHYTKTFAEHVLGGQAAAFSWVQVADDYQGLILSEGIRGANELSFALHQCHSWHIVELALHPITRLKRLSGRKDTFDKASGKGDVQFLPDAMHSEAQQLVETGEISTKALTIMRAESENYGLFPFDNGEGYANYHRIDTDDLTPEQVAESVYDIVRDIIHADD